MRIMSDHDWYDKKVIHTDWSKYGDDEAIEITFSEAIQSLYIGRHDVITLANEFGLVVYPKDAAL